MSYKEDLQVIQYTQLNLLLRKTFKIRCLTLLMIRILGIFFMCDILLWILILDLFFKTRITMNFCQFF